MSSHASDESDSSGSHIAIAFDQPQIPEDCQSTGNTVMCSTADHHADPIPLSKGIKLYGDAAESELRSSGMVTVKHVVKAGHQLKSEYGEDICGGFFVEVMTAEHESYPTTIFHGLVVRQITRELKFDRSTQQQFENHFDNASVVSANSLEMVAVTTTDSFPNQYIDSLRDDNSNIYL